MTLPEIAKFLDEHPDFAPVFTLNVRGKYFVDGFSSPGCEFFSLQQIAEMLRSRAKPA